MRKEAVFTGIFVSVMTAFAADVIFERYVSTGCIASFFKHPVVLTFGLLLGESASEAVSFFVKLMAERRVLIYVIVLVAIVAVVLVVAYVGAVAFPRISGIIAVQVKAYVAAKLTAILAPNVIIRINVVILSEGFVTLVASVLVVALRRAGGVLSAYPIRAVVVRTYVLKSAD
jgi:hypothetical protein